MIEAKRAKLGATSERAALTLFANQKNVAYATFF
jgi:hypothetical protein